MDDLKVLGSPLLEKLMPVLQRVGGHRSGNVHTPRVTHGCDGTQRLYSRCQSPAAHKGGKSLIDTWRFLLSGPLAPCKAILQSMDLLLDLMLMESGWWRGLHNSPPFL